jgi:predicted  nucleic acid-binding Zn-ribbon protein
MSILNGPSDGTWSVFASKVVRERDDARYERDEARKELAAAKLRVSDLKHALGIDAQGWFDRFKQAQKECEIFKSRLDHAEADFDQAMHYETTRALNTKHERDKTRKKLASLKSQLTSAETARDEAVALLREIYEAQSQSCVGRDYPASEATPCGDCIWCRCRKIMA